MPLKCEREAYPVNLIRSRQKRKKRGLQPTIALELFPRHDV